VVLAAVLPSGDGQLCWPSVLANIACGLPFQMTHRISKQSVEHGGL
jgi:hypothetical protein